jgi:hypothetical protein
MYCPTCGQQQVSNETKFCNRCGMPLNLVAEVVSYGGYLPQLAELDKVNETKWTRKNGLIAAIFWFIILTPFQAALIGTIFGATPVQGFLAVLGVFGALLIALASMIFLPGAKRRYLPTGPATIPNAQIPGANQAALPPQQSIPVSSYGPPQAGNWRDTNDLQPSVTEGTTRMLDDEEQRRQ